jgi:hypothetical protein
METFNCLNFVPKSRTEFTETNEPEKEQTKFNKLANYVMEYAIINFSEKDYAALLALIEVVDDTEGFDCGSSLDFDILLQNMVEKNIKLETELSQARDQLKAFQPEASV